MSFSHPGIKDIRPACKEQSSCSKNLDPSHIKEASHPSPSLPVCKSNSLNILVNFRKNTDRMLININKKFGELKHGKALDEICQWVRRLRLNFKTRCTNVIRFHEETCNTRESC